MKLLKNHSKSNCTRWEFQCQEPPLEIDPHPALAVIFAKVTILMTMMMSMMVTMIMVTVVSMMVTMKKQQFLC